MTLLELNLPYNTPLEEAASRKTDQYTELMEFMGQVHPHENQNRVTWSN